MANSRDLFGAAARKAPAAPRAEKPAASAEDGYTAASIEVLEGLEPVRRRPGMFIGGTDEAALHHLFAEVIDNSMDEAVAGHATFIDVVLEADGYVTVTDNGRGMPVDPHPKFKDKSTVEVIMTVLHAGGKFDSGAYQTSGGLHGVGVSVVNALSEHLEVEVARGQTLYRQSFSRGLPMSELQTVGKVSNRRGTKVRFKPDPLIFGPEAALKPARLFRMSRSKAYLFGGVEIRWKNESASDGGVPREAVFHFPGGLKDYLAQDTAGKVLVTDQVFTGNVKKPNGHGSMEWAVCWLAEDDGFVHSYCNTIPTPDGGTHEAGLRAALLRGLREHAERVGQAKRASVLTADDVMVSCAALISVFLKEPEFQGQNKGRLMTAEASRLVEGSVRDAFDHWLADFPSQAFRSWEHGHFHHACLRPGRGRARGDGPDLPAAHADRPDRRDHVLPRAAAAAEGRARARRRAEEHPPRRHGGDERRHHRQGHQGRRRQRARGRDRGERARPRRPRHGVRGARQGRAGEGRRQARRLRDRPAPARVGAEVTDRQPGND